MLAPWPWLASDRTSCFYGWYSCNLVGRLSFLKRLARDCHFGGVLGNAGVVIGVVKFFLLRRVLPCISLLLCTLLFSFLIPRWLSHCSLVIDIK